MVTVNVYAAPMTDGRISKLKALCKIRDEEPKAPVTDTISGYEMPTPLINMDLLNDINSKTETETISSDNRRKCRSDNK